MISFTDLSRALAVAPVVPVLTVNNAADAVPLSRALSAGGLTVLEVTLRTAPALEVISQMRAAVPDLRIGAGTILSAKDVDTSAKAGAHFLVSPGMTDALNDAVKANNALLLPGVATPSEAMARSEEGYECLKLFPANILGGVAMLKALSGPLGHLKFMPTGGISDASAGDYLSEPNVVAIGGGWLAPAGDIAAGNWQAIEARARAAVTLSKTI